MIRFRCGLRQTGIDVVAHLGLRGLGSATVTCAVPVPLAVVGCRDGVKDVLEPIGNSHGASILQGLWGTSSRWRTMGAHGMEYRAKRDAAYGPTLLRPAGCDIAQTAPFERMRP
jgi:hypothetical protein